MWVLFRVPCPTPDGRTAHDLYQSRVSGISTRMQESAAQHGCRFHRAWYAQDGSEFIALAKWDSADGARAFYQTWSIDDEPGETATLLEGDIGLIPEP
jgi:hypothetical protein